MNRLDKRFESLREHGKKAVILFVTAGDPDLPTTLDIIKALAANGTDCIELGIPFSDPIADGPVIQQSTARALANHITFHEIWNLVETFRKDYDTPIVLMGYLNPILRYGTERFVRDCRRCGVDGLIIADLPYEEGEELERICREQDVHLIYLLAPEEMNARTEKIVHATRGFLYLVSHYGTTGRQEHFQKNLKRIVRSVRTLTSLPVAIGFGISSIQQARDAAEIADGVIVGSWLIRELEQSDTKTETAVQFVRRLRQAVDGG